MMQHVFSLPFILASTPQGYLHCTTDGDALLRIEWAQTPLKSPVPPAFQPFAKTLTAYGNGAVIDHWPVSITLHGSPFYRKVWEALGKVAYGDTISYSELAFRAGRPHAIRAAASACAKNPLPLIIPCHRVIAKDGGMGGFAWGLDVKRALLQREASARSSVAA